MNRIFPVAMVCAAFFAFTLSSQLFAQTQVQPATQPSTLAWWRFEDVEPKHWLQARVGSNRAGFTVTQDSSGNDNSLRTFNTTPTLYPPDTSPEFSDDVPAAIVHQQPNHQSIHLNGKQYLYTTTRALDQSLQTNQPSPFTIEGMFKLATLPGNYDGKAQVILCKINSPSTQPTTTITNELADQFSASTSRPAITTTRPTTSPTTRPTTTQATTEPVEIPFATDNLPNDHPQQPVVFVVAGRNSGSVPINHLAVRIEDRNRQSHVLVSKNELVANRWYAFALTSDGRTAEMYLSDLSNGEYQLQASTNLASGIFRGRGIWNIGCGLIDDQHDSWFQGYIDEIRISAGFLEHEQWLGNKLVQQNHRATLPRVDQSESYQPAVKGLADPAVLKVGDTYYLYGTQEQDSFPVYISNDLKRWHKDPTAFKKSPGMWGNSRFWAPSVIAYRGKYYMFYSALGPLHDSGERHSHRVCIAKADRPEGPFENYVAPLPLTGKAAIDPCAFVDQDGHVYLYFVSDCSENVVSQIFAVRMNADLNGIEGEPVLCTQPTQVWEGIMWNEAPSVFRTGNIYVLLYSAQFWHGPEYACGFATSRSPQGPWSKNPDNPFLSHYRQLKGTGSVGTVTAPDGKSTLIFFHAQGPPNSDRRDVYFDQLLIQPDDRLGVTLLPKPWQN